MLYQLSYARQSRRNFPVRHSFSDGGSEGGHKRNIAKIWPLNKRKDPGSCYIARAPMTLLLPHALTSYSQRMRDISRHTPRGDTSPRRHREISDSLRNRTRRVSHHVDRTRPWVVRNSTSARTRPEARMQIRQGRPELFSS